MMKNKFILAAVVGLAVAASACGNGKKEDSGKEGAQIEDTRAEDAQAEGESEKTASAADGISYDIDQCVKLGDYQAIHVSLSDTYEVTDEQVEDYAMSMAEYYAGPSYKDTDKQTVESGDIVNIDYVGKKDGVAFDGGTASGYNLTIGSGSFIDGFEDGLIGKNVGETVDLNLTFPENYQSEDLAGADVVFTVTINKIVVEDEDAKVELTDEFVAANFGYDTVAEYKENVKKYLETSNETSKKTDSRQAVIDKLQETCEVTLPDGLLDARVDDYVTQFTNKNCADTTLADYLSDTYNMTEEDFRGEVTAEMQENLTTELILEAVAKKEGIELVEDDFQAYVKEQMSANSYQTAEDFYSANGVDAASGEKYERKVFVCNQALDKIMESASIEYGVEEKE